MMRGSALSGVLYAEDFDAPEERRVLAEPAPRPEPVVLEPTFSLIDLQRAAEHARMEEREAAILDGERTAAALRADALARIADSLSQARADSARIAQRAADATAQTVLAAVSAVLPGFAARHGAAEAAMLLRLLLPAMANEPRLTIRAHPALIEQLRPDAAALLDTGSAAVEWLAADAMPRGDLAIAWQDGQAVRDVAALCAQVTALLMPDTLSEESPDAH